MTDSVGIGYGRVSTLDQRTGSQHDPLVAAGCDPERVYVDKATGTYANRPELRAALRACRVGDEFMVTKLDRLGRSIRDLYEVAELLADRGVVFRIVDINMVVNFADPFGKMFFGQLALFAEFERDLIRMRTNEGLAAARARGRVGGRKPKLNRTAAAHVRAMYEAVGDDGRRLHRVRDIAAAFKVTRATVYRKLGKTAQPVGEAVEHTEAWPMIAPTGTSSANAEETARFWSHVVKRPGKHDCWLWTGASEGVPDCGDRVTSASRSVGRRDGVVHLATRGP